MKRSFVLFLLAVFILAVILSGCVPSETGTISFTTPTFGQIIQEDFLEESPSIPLVVSSTYLTDKVVHFLINNQESYDCLVKANAVNQVCQSIPLKVPGEYIVIAEVDLQDGSVVTSEVRFDWIPEETGTILFTSPSPDEVIRDGYRGISSQNISVKMSSTFRRDKLIRYTVGGQTEAVSCLVKANAVDQECPPVTLTESGEYTITASTELINGSFTTRRVTFSWEPYTSLDRIMIEIGWSDSPVRGYLISFGILVFIITMITSLITKDRARVSVAGTIVTAISILALCFLPTPGLAVSLSCWLVPLLVVLGSVAFWLVRHPRPVLVIGGLEDGSQLIYSTRPRRGEPRKTIFIDERTVAIDENTVEGEIVSSVPINKLEVTDE
ncbi:MAG: hypothetical protein UW41_C0004G0029 [Candidatus Collierbacteria bacterium GW2011_GWC2_44_18]|uniref:Uncharacterized protein n=1 Tax=Candidatus Collierbacteria bacterium GW2011_GWC2_44_18 TaxID=1618392 RepID=A0A0G1HSI4_9BACT|nr:MAG: hypothetical protein UW41_C0004G0029 [Candidatus Collierbacteria bacterium GW2011_GWC2_44_18]